MNAKMADGYEKKLRESSMMVDELKTNLSHLGFDEEPYTDQMLAPKTRNVDIIVGGHSHTKLKDAARIKNIDGKDVIIVQDWKWGLMAGNLKVNL